MTSTAPVLALGGGGMRGVAHLGVLRELERAGIEPAAVAGTSSGALMGALWLLHGADGAIDKVREFVGSAFVSRMPNLLEQDGARGVSGLVGRLRRDAVMVRLLLSRSQMSRSRFLEQIAFLLPDVTLAELRRPLVAVATDTDSGREVHVDRGSVRIAVGASSAMPGLVLPLRWEGHRLQDGGAVGEIPVRAARALGSPVVAVEVSEGFPAPQEGGDRVPRAMLRAAAMGWQELRRRILDDADAVVAPRINHLHWADFHAVDEAVDAGAAAARAFLDSAQARSVLSGG